MGTILGLEYSETRENEDGETEYYVDCWDDWYTREEIKEENEELDYWIKWGDGINDEENGGTDWSDS